MGEIISVANLKKVNQQVLKLANIVTLPYGRLSTKIAPPDAELAEF